MLDRIVLDGFVWQSTVYDKQGNIVDQWEEHNLIPNEGVAFLMRSPFGDAQPVSNFYCGIFKGNYLPTAASKATDIPNIGEVTSYQEVSRPLWNKVFDGSNTFSNSSNPAIFTFTEEQTINGYFLVSSDIKGSSNGILLSIARLSTPKTVSEELKVKTRLSYLSGTSL
ncbi:hypothetical protein MTZ49_07220 [Entomomonas sp. E2T0]|uniref:hypothetical protein n=1 Tax=Entomomonas sp. E2T0 TaxID=2930213 RepID=UPI0022280F89|nr:hypothetical protein [Entomomonas sp. E2T0]UYZ85329.1 hypothetical protein MTZ49_07220 [Entomomonas sp. E2T0]